VVLLRPLHHLADYFDSEQAPSSYLARSSSKLSLTIYLDLGHLKTFWRHRSDRSGMPVRPVDASSAISFLPCPQALESVDIGFWKNMSKRMKRSSR
jgi:hypothetical protein